VKSEQEIHLCLFLASKCMPVCIASLHSGIQDYYASVTQIYSRINC